MESGGRSYGTCGSVPNTTMRPSKPSPRRVVTAAPAVRPPPTMTNLLASIWPHARRWPRWGRTAAVNNVAGEPADPAGDKVRAHQAPAPYLRLPGERDQPDGPAVPTGAEFRERWRALDPAAREDIRRRSNRGEPSPPHRALMAAAWAYRLHGQRRMARAAYAVVSVLLAIAAWRTSAAFRYRTSSCWLCSSAVRVHREVRATAAASRLGEPPTVGLVRRQAP